MNKRSQILKYVEYPLCIIIHLLGYLLMTAFASLLDKHWNYSFSGFLICFTADCLIVILSCVITCLALKFDPVHYILSFWIIPLASLFYCPRGIYFFFLNFSMFWARNPSAIECSFGVSINLVIAELAALLPFLSKERGIKTVNKLI